MELEKLKYLYYLTKIKHLGNIRIKKIVDYYKDPQVVFQLSKTQLNKIEGIEDKTSEIIINSKKNFDEFERDFESLLENVHRKNIKIVNLFSDNYPENLKKIYDAPVILYYIGELLSDDKYAISIVGTRTPTIYGKSVSERLVEELCNLGIVTISGMAKGIDALVHYNTLKTGGRTYAVLGNGVDIIYPPENRNIYELIKERGVIISDFEPGLKPERVNFPKRNRIVSGLGLGTLIIETAIKGGSMITAEFALDQNKEIFAVPGNINSKKSEGNNDLIKKGTAKLVTCIDDILNELSYVLKPLLKKEAKENEQQIIAELDIFERKIYDVLTYEPIHIDKINEITELSISDCLVTLLSLEFKNLIKQLPGKFFVKM